MNGAPNNSLSDMCEIFGKNEFRKLYKTDCCPIWKG